MSQTGVSSEGTAETMRVLPAKSARAAGARSLVSSVKSGAAVPTESSGPSKVRGAPWKVTAPWRSCMMNLLPKGG